MASGLALISVSNALKLRTGFVLLTSSTCGTTTTMPIGVSCLSGSKPSLSRCGAMTWPELVAISSVAVGRGLGREVGRDRVGGPGLVLDDDRLAQRAAHLLAEQASNHVGAAAGGGADVDADRLVGEGGLRVGAEGGGQHRKERKEREKRERPQAVEVHRVVSGGGCSVCSSW